MPELKLKTVTRTQGNNQGLKDGSVKARTFAFEFVEIPVLIDGSAAWCGDSSSISARHGAAEIRRDRKAHGRRRTAPSRDANHRDPLPYGVEPNRKVVEELIGHALSQRIITHRLNVDELFA